MTFSIQHTAIGTRPSWHLLEREACREKATRRANQYALDHGGYVCVTDHAGKIVFGTDPSQLDCAIATGINLNFKADSHN